MARTRASKGADKAISSKGKNTTTSSTSKHSLPEESTNPPKILILPNKATPEARVVSLKNPRYSKPTRYLICPETGAYELTRISAPKTTPRSWLIEDASETENKLGKIETREEKIFETQVTRDAELYLATSVDPLFLALPALQAQFDSTSKRLFLSSDDHIDTIVDETPHFRQILTWSQWRRLLEARMAAICDTAEAGDETMFRFSEEKLLDQILIKARKMSENRLPKSMEEKFVIKALEAPVLGVKRSNPTVSLETQESSLSESNTDSAESQSTVVTTATSISQASTAATSVAKDAESAIQTPEEVIKLQRLRIAFSFICSSYLPPSMTAVLKKMLGEGKGAIDFSPLDNYITQLTKLRQEATTARSALDYSRKRTLDEEDEDRMEKRRKKEEEEKRKKAGESRGVKELKKVNVSGMKKMSDFFKPKGS